MGKFDDILICTDLDGTLLASDHRVSRENLEAIEYFKSEGGYFTFITGRMPSCVANIYNTVSPNVPFGCINGGGLFDHRLGKYVASTPLDLEALELVDYVDRTFSEVGIQVNSFDTIYFCKESSAMAYFRKVTGMPNVIARPREIKEPIAKVVFGDMDRERISRLRDALFAHPLGNKFSFTRSESFLYEILPKGISKATALEALSRHLGIPRERCIALGDYNNDVEMLRYAGVGITVANATEAAKAAADRITVSNDLHAIAKTVEDIESGKIIL